MKTFRKTIAVTTLLTFSAIAVNAQAPTSWPKGPMLVNARVTPAGQLVITPSKTSSARDFDYLAGKWTMHHYKLKSRLTHSNEWEQFESTDENHGILDGIGNTDILKTTLNGKPFEGLTLRLFNPKTRLWSLYWVASNSGVLDPPVVGAFEGNIGRFYTRDTYEGKSIIMMFVWDKTDKNNPVWSQAFSPDNGKTWEWNWTNTSHRIK